MTLSPKKYVSNFTSSTTNRGVEAKEIEIANTHLDINVSSSQESSNDIDVRSQGSQNDTGSYIQVVVQKHKHKEPIVVATQTSPRLPVASSPIKAVNASGDYLQNVYMLQQPMLLAYPQQNFTKPEPKTELKRKLTPVKEEKTPNKSFWTKFQEIANDNSPDRVELYYFERTTGDFLSTTDGVVTYAERFALRSSRFTNKITAEVFSVPQLVLNIPVSIFLQLERSVLIILRHFLVGSVQIFSDYFFKPFLTLSFNAIIQPPLVFLGNVLKAFREVVTPIANIIGDLIDPVAKLLGSFRLVNVERCRYAQEV